MASEFNDLVETIPTITKEVHSKTLVENARANLPRIKKTIKDLSPPSGAKAKSTIIVSAGPSVHRQKSIHKIVASNYSGNIVAVDGSYIACLKAGLVPDYVLSLDSHFSRVVRWFGDPDFEKHSASDDYFARQDLDIDFRANSTKHNLQNIEIINANAHKTKLILCSSTSNLVANRVEQAGFDIYWWNPLVDNPSEKNSLTRELYKINKLPTFNTGGNVGTAAWVFASAVLKIPMIALAGMDFGYYNDTPLNQTQYYYELIDRLGTNKDIEKYFRKMTYPGTGESFYTDAPYHWYCEAFMELYKNAFGKTYNCTEGGTLIELPCIPLTEFIRLQEEGALLG